MNLKESKEGCIGIFGQSKVEKETISFYIFKKENKKKKMKNKICRLVCFIGIMDVN